MSYDLRLGVKVAEWGGFADIAEPEYRSPSCNMGNLFRACTGWNFEQGRYYRVSEVVDKIVYGIQELRGNREAYREYEPRHRIGAMESAARTLEALLECITDTAELVPMRFLWVAW